MILPDYQIRKWAASNIEPYNPENVNPASIDLCASNMWIDLYDLDTVIITDSIWLYPRSIGVELYNVFAKLFRLPRKHVALLASTLERIRIPNGMAAMMKLKTTPSRSGLGHPIADWVDPGFTGQLTMAITANKPIKLYCGQRICQLVLMTMDACNKPYFDTGHYQNQSGPTISWLDAMEVYGKQQIQ